MCVCVCVCVDVLVCVCVSYTNIRMGFIPAQHSSGLICTGSSQQYVSQSGWLYVYIRCFFFDSIWLYASRVLRISGGMRITSNRLPTAPLRHPVPPRYCRPAIRLLYISVRTICMWQQYKWLLHTVGNVCQLPLRTGSHARTHVCICTRTHTTQIHRDTLSKLWLPTHNNVTLVVHKSILATATLTDMIFSTVAARCSNTSPGRQILSDKTHVNMAKIVTSSAWVLTRSDDRTCYKIGVIIGRCSISGRRLV